MTLRGWRAHAACLDADPELFFPTVADGATVWKATGFCHSRCTVRQACLDEALSYPEYVDHGVWGGYTAPERIRMRRERRRAAAAQPGVD